MYRHDTRPQPAATCIFGVTHLRYPGSHLNRFLRDWVELWCALTACGLDRGYDTAARLSKSQRVGMAQREYGEFYGEQLLVVRASISFGVTAGEIRM